MGGCPPEGHPGGHPHGKAHPGAEHAPKRYLDDGVTPICRLIAWEVTRSCNLACKHCRAEAHPEPYEGELSTAEAKALIDTFPDAGSPIIIFTGGEPMMRGDVYELVAYAKSKGLRCVMAPNGTLITPETAQQMKEAGIERCSISIDAPEAVQHDEFRGEVGAFDASMRGIQYLKDAGIEFQINTTVTKNNLHLFKDIFHLCEDIGAAAWHIFLLVPTGRAVELGTEIITAEEYEDVLNWFYDFRKTTNMQLKATCAPHYHRILRQRAKEEGVPVNFENFGLDAVSRGLPGRRGLLLHLPPGPGPALRLPGAGLRQRPRDSLPGNLEKIPAIPQPAQPGGLRRQVRVLRIRKGLRRLPSPRPDHERPLLEGRAVVLVHAEKKAEVGFPRAHSLGSGL